jgi:hypothetical protein
MKKRLLLIVIQSFFLLTSNSLKASSANDDGLLVPLDVEVVDPTHGSGTVPRTPILVPTASLDGNTFYINSGHADFVVQLLDEDDNVVYQTVMPSETNSIVLPSTLSGDYQIQLLWGDWMLYGWINL